MLTIQSHRCPMVGSQSKAPGLWKGLVGLWAPSLGPTGSRLWDVSGFGNHGTLTNMDPAAGWTVGNNSRRPGYQLDYVKADSQYVALGVDLGGDQGTLVAWVRPTMLRTEGSNFGIVATNNDNFREISLSYHGFASINRFTGRYRGASPFTIKDSVSPRILTDAEFLQWHCVVYTYGAAANTGQIWDNGVAGSINPASSGAWPGDTFDIGRLGSNGNHWEGGIGLVIAYDRILADSESQHLYELPQDMFTPRPRVFPAAVAAPPAGIGGSPLRMQTPLAGAL